MKKLALMMIFGIAGVVLSAEEYTIQTISALKESSITPAFEKKVDKTSLPSAKKKEGECNIVTVGHYMTAKKARSDLAKAKTIAKDAFVRPAVRAVPQGCTAHVSASKANETKTVVKSDINGSAPHAKQSDVVAVHASPVACAPQPVVSAVSSAVQPQPHSEAVSTAVFIYDRNAIRKSDISEAINFYKNSPYHTFKPVALAR